MEAENDVVHVRHRTAGSYLRELRRQKILTRVYARIYYKRAREWGRWYLILQFSPVGVSLLGAVLALMLQDATTAKYIASMLAIFSGGLVTVSTLLNPAKREERNENAGDRYRISAARLEPVDDTYAIEELRRLAQETRVDMEKLALDTTEPEPNTLSHELKKMERRIANRAKQMRYQSDSEGEEGFARQETLQVIGSMV